MQHACKEWAVICRALALGRQFVLLRKGGLIEPQARFVPAHDRFWLFPTYLHQTEAGLNEEGRRLLDEAPELRLEPTPVILNLWAEVAARFECRSLAQVEALRPWHLWSDDLVAERFHRWNDDRVCVLVLRVHALAQPVEVPRVPGYGGCTSWIDLETDVLTEPSKPVVEEGRFREVRAAIERALAFAGAAGLSHRNTEG